MSESGIQQHLEAILLDRESVVLVTGDAVLYPPISSGSFAPALGTTAEEVETMRSKAGFLKTLAGGLYAVEPDSGVCQACSRAPHFHFNYTAP